MSFQFKCSNLQARFGASERPINKKNVGKFISKYSDRHGVNQEKPACPFMEKIERMESVPEIKELRHKPKTYGKEEARDIITSAIIRGIRVSAKTVEDKVQFSIFSPVQEKAVLHEEAKAFKVLVSKDKQFLSKLAEILNKTKQ